MSQRDNKDRKCVMHFILNGKETANHLYIILSVTQTKNYVF